MANCNIIFTFQTCGLWYLFSSKFNYIEIIVMPKLNTFVESACARLPRIGEMIEAATGLKYETYSRAQKELGLEAAMAAIASHPDYRHPDGRGLAEVVYELLHKQARTRMAAVKADAQAMAQGHELKMIVDGQMKEMPKSSYLMVQMAEQAPKDLEAVLGRAREGVKDLGWLRAEGASNATNHMRDIMLTIPQSRRLDESESEILMRAVRAAEEITKAITSGKGMHPDLEERNLRYLKTALSFAESTAPAVREHPNYAHYCEAMPSGIHNGLEATRRLAARGFGRS